MPDAIDALEKLNGFADAYIVTYARKEAYGLGHIHKLNWLREHAPFFDRDKVIFTRHKHLIGGHYMVEDSVENLARWTEQLPHGIGLLVDAPWNRTAPLPPRCRRVRDLAHAVHLIAAAEGTGT